MEKFDKTNPYNPKTVDTQSKKIAFKNIAFFL
jgi:hypothetical protein